MCPSQALAEVAAVEQLGDRVRDTVLGAEVVDVEDVRVGELGDGPRLAFESREPTLILRGFRRQHFDSDITAEFGVTGAVDFSHTAFADKATIS